MPTLQVTLSEQAAAAARTRMASGGFASVEDYLASLIDADAGVPVSASLEAELVAGLDGDGVPVSAVDWPAKRAALAARPGGGR